MKISKWRKKCISAAERECPWYWSEWNGL